MSFPKQKKPRSWRVLQDWIRHYADQEELPQSRVRRAVSFMGSDSRHQYLPRQRHHRLQGQTLGQGPARVAPVEVEAVLDIDQVEPFDIGQFGLESPGQISVVGLPYLIAQKLHACTEVFDGQENERVHDLMDLLLARDLLEPASLVRVREACEAIFANRPKHPWPPELTVYPSWAETYRAIAEEEAFPVEDVEEAASQVRASSRRSTRLAEAEAAQPQPPNC